MGFGGECGNSRAARADSTHAWVWYRRAEQLARMERDLTAHTAALETADAAKWVKRRENCSTHSRTTISMNMSTSPCGRSATESAERRRGAGAPAPWKRQTREGGTGRVSYTGFRSCVALGTTFQWGKVLLVPFVVVFFLFALGVVPCSLPSPRSLRRRRALASQGRRLDSAEIRSSAPTHRSAFHLPSVPCTSTLADARMRAASLAAASKLPYCIPLA